MGNHKRLITGSVATQLIKEVANVYFEALADEDNGRIKAGDIVMYLDTLKVSTIETTAQNVSATGGWG